MRIVSLEPGATEILCAIGLGDEIVGVADDPSAVDLAELVATPFVAHARWDSGGLRRVDVDTDALAATSPGLIVAARAADIPAGAVEGATILSFEPTSLEGVFNAIAAIGAMTSAEDAALELIEDLRNELGVIEERVRERSDDGRRPVRAIVLESLDPPLASGLWVPEQVRRAGGWELLGVEGASPRAATWEAVADLDPEVLFVSVRGSGLPASMRAWEAIPAERVAGLPVVGAGRVYALDGRSYLSVAGPRLVDGVALLAELLDPGAFEDIAPQTGWAPLS
ncbi:MAG TPA: ABC transporter substrate-binding protein [Candidatus Limnocylindrales bacterium]